MVGIFISDFYQDWVEVNKDGDKLSRGINSVGLNVNSVSSTSGGERVSSELSSGNIKNEESWCGSSVVLVVGNKAQRSSNVNITESIDQVS